MSTTSKAFIESIDKKKLAGIGLALAATGLGTFAIYKFLQKKKAIKKVFSRLPKDVVPEHYNLLLNVLLEDKSFKGEEEVLVTVRTPTNKIILNAAELKFGNASFITSSGTKLNAKIFTNEEEEIATFQFSQNLPIGQGTLKIDFDGILNDKLKGFYSSKYTTPQGEERVMAVTQFEATDARRCFPCWDEPAVKATFKCSLIIPNKRIAISTTPIVHEEVLPDDTRKIEFDKTPKISTYLLAFIVGEFDYVEGTTPNGITVRIYTPVGKSNQGTFGLEVALKTLPFYEDFFGIKYPLPKCDLIAVPDFSAGAMENWGAITYRETALLIDPQNSSATSKQWVALVIGHELAHQWFGNIVTMEWWTHLWLNEGFASYVEYICVNHCFPEWDIWTQFVYQDFGRALSLDGMENSHPVEVEVGHPHEIDEIFDAISYSKGSVIIRMLYEYLGKEAFSQGINSYLKKFEYSNAFTEDLWESLATASGKPVKEIMDTWTKQTGFPVLNVVEKVNDEGITLTITQSRFLNSGISNEKTLWQIPLSYVSASISHTSLSVMKEKEIQINLKGISSNDWIKLNASQVGLYRCNYSSSMLGKLQKAIANRDKQLTPSDRLGIQNDAFFLAKAGLASTVDALRLIAQYTNEDHYTVWADLSSNLSELNHLLSNTDIYPAFQKFCRNLYQNIAKNLGWEERKGESHLDTLTRGLVLQQLAKYEELSVQQHAQKKFDDFIQSQTPIHPDLRSVVYSCVISTGNETTFDTFIKLYKETSLNEEKVRIIRSLGSASKPELLKRTLEFAITEVRSQDAVFVIEAVSFNRNGRELAWQFIKDNWKTLNERYSGGFLLTRLLKSTLSNFASEDKVKDIEEFFARNPLEAKRTLNQCIESIKSNISWLKRDEAALRQYFASQ